MHVGSALKLLDASHDGIALTASRRGRQLALEATSLLDKTLLESVGLRAFPFPHRAFSGVAIQRCWPSDRVLR